MKRTSIHEAGHAIAALETGCDLHHVALKGAGGECRWTVYDDETEAVVIAAGCAAERYLCNGAAHVKGTDLQKMRTLWTDAPTQAPFRRWVEAHVRKAAHVLHSRDKCLKRLAAHLRDRGRLSESDVHRVIAPTTPQPFTYEEKSRLTEADRRRADRRAKAAVKSFGAGALDVEQWKALQERRAEEYAHILRKKCNRDDNQAACAVVS